VHLRTNGRGVLRGLPVCSTIFAHSTSSHSTPMNARASWQVMKSTTLFAFLRLRPTSMMLPLVGMLLCPITFISLPLFHRMALPCPLGCNRYGTLSARNWYSWEFTNRTGRKAFSIIYCAARKAIQTNGNMSVSTRCEQNCATYRMPGRTKERSFEFHLTSGFAATSQARRNRAVTPTDRDLVVAASLCRGAPRSLPPQQHGDTAPWLQQPQNLFVAASLCRGAPRSLPPQQHGGTAP
jgi:hypothetical protein